MSDKTHIEWTDATWNVVTGCAKVSQGCKNCYALRDWPRLAANPKTVYFGREFTDVRCHSERLEIPMRWTKPRRIFVNSMSDLFHPDVPDFFIDQVFAVMARARHHTFQVLTKRPDRMREYLNTRDRTESILFASCSVPCCAMEWIREWPLPNVWLGVSVEDQDAADERIPLLLQTPAAVRWISAEPLLGPINLSRYLSPRQTVNPDGYGGDVGVGWTTDFTTLDWVIAGGESGPKARPMHPVWARSLRDQCAAAGVPFHFKQWGEWAPSAPANYCQVTKKRWSHESFCWADEFNAYNPIKPSPSHLPMHTVYRVGKRAAGRLLDGVQHDEYPR